ncbi:hypothetical protein JOE44_004560 [Chryseobacterium sp. PvR013]|uniref:hypothetical protein n=1 Tax=Chryseobacterium sp. PvR013 TaxID=2806595 RepID=UPI001AEA66DE|nr:hypothetical protein [Chryseobacterium sp. PvR013]MBP1167676.1 hypothetical protein [Chryseobacterium sp. PvR013]
MKKVSIIFLLSFCLFSNAQEKESLNSATRKFISGADFTQINKDWNVTADFRSGIGEQVSFFPVEAINLKTNQKMKSIQVNMNIKSDFMGKSKEYFKTSWLDLDEVEEFVLFIEQYVIPNLKDKTENKQSTNYIFNSKEISFNFYIEKNTRRISIYLKDYGITDNEHYFWTESQVNKIPELLEILKKINGK